MTSNAPSPSAAPAMHVLVPACDSHGDNGSSSEWTPRSSPGTARETVAEVVAGDRRRKHPSQQRNVNNSRDRMKQEMHHLRGTVEELKRQLDEIKRDHVRRSPRPNSALTPGAAQLIAAWESLARGQCEQRYRAEVENVKLRKMLDDQVKIAQTLERVLTKRRGVEQWFDSENNIKRTRTSPHGSTAQEDVLAEMGALLPSLYMQVDTVLAKDCFSKGAGESTRHIDVRHADATGTYVEATEKRVVPFSIEDAGAALWENLVFYPNLRPTNDDATRKAELSQNVIVRETEVRLKLSRFTGPLRVKFTARRYVEANRSVIVWVAVADPTDIQEMQLDGVHMRNTGWVCARAAPVGTTANTMAECLWAQLAVPEFANGHTGGGDHKRRMYTLTNFIVSWIHSQMDSSNHALDNRLLERSLARANKAERA